MTIPSIDNAIYIDNNEQLVLLCESFKTARFLAVDTEFIRTDTFYPIAGLLQLSVGQENYLVDPLTIDQWQPLIDVFIDENIPKVLHSCSEDLEVFDRLLGVLPKPLFDSQIAAAMLGYGFSLSYQNLVNEILSQHVEKGETRSNWLQRPLTASQCHYAALDVEYLSDVYLILQAALKDKGRLEWLQQDCDKLLVSFKNNQYTYKKVKSAWKLSPKQLNVLDQLIQWREQQAKIRNVPRGRILKDKSCFEIASKLVKTVAVLAKITDVNPKTVRVEGETIIQLVMDASQQDGSEFPAAMVKPLPLQMGTVMKELKAAVVKLSEELNVAQEILVRKKDYEALLRSGLSGNSHQLPKTLQGWREGIVGKLLLDKVKR
ncbi:MAG: ribonuclease D [Pseudohongiellaceae bacterium]|jgi:ribonuclease D